MQCVRYKNGKCRRATLHGKTQPYRLRGFTIFPSCKEILSQENVLRACTTSMLSFTKKGKKIRQVPVRQIVHVINFRGASLQGRLIIAATAV
jgi:hypothetical protein